jgi:hypothetical protein
MEYKVKISHVQLKFRCCVIGHLNPRCSKPLGMWKLISQELCYVKSWGCYCLLPQIVYMYVPSVWALCASWLGSMWTQQRIQI